MNLAPRLVSRREALHLLAAAAQLGYRAAEVEAEVIAAKGDWGAAQDVLELRRVGEAAQVCTPSLLGEPCFAAEAGWGEVRGGVHACVRVCAVVTVGRGHDLNARIHAKCVGGEIQQALQLHASPVWRAAQSCTGRAACTSFPFDDAPPPVFYLPTNESCWADQSGVAASLV